MPRPARGDFAGAYHHVTNRGNDGQVIFQDDWDRGAFLDCFAAAVAREDWRCHAYCLMDNHFHLLVETPAANLARGMQWLAAVWTQRINRRHQRSGHLFQGRYKSVAIERDSHLLEAVRYIALNPVRAGLVRRAQDWRWSHHRALAGLAAAADWLTCDWVWAQLAADTMAAQAAYRGFVAEGRGLPPEAQSPWLMSARARRRGEALAMLRAMAEESQNRSWMWRAHALHGFSQSLIAEAAGVSRPTVIRELRRHGEDSSRRAVHENALTPNL